MTDTKQAQPDTSPLGPVDRSLPIALLRARERAVRPLRGMLTDVGVTEQQWRVLRVLYEEGETEANKVADRACLFMSSMTRIGQALVTQGLISRRQNPADRRRLFLSITSKGRRIIDDNAARSRATTERLRRRFGEDRYETLLDLLSELNRLDD